MVESSYLTPMVVITKFYDIWWRLDVLSGTSGFQDFFRVDRAGARDRRDFPKFKRSEYIRRGLPKFQLLKGSMFFQVLDGLNTSVIGSEAIEWVESEKSKISIIQPISHIDWGSFQVLKILPKAQIWCSLGPRWGIGIWKVVSKGLLVFPEQLGGSELR